MLYDDRKLNVSGHDGSMFAFLINHTRMDFILMRRHRRLVWPRAQSCHPSSIVSEIGKTPSVLFMHIIIKYTIP